MVQRRCRGHTPSKEQLGDGRLQLLSQQYRIWIEMMKTTSSDYQLWYRRVMVSQCRQKKFCCNAILVLFLDGGEGEPIGIECAREQVRRSGPSELRRRGGNGEPHQEDGTLRPTTLTHIVLSFFCFSCLFLLFS